MEESKDCADAKRPVIFRYCGAEYGQPLYQSNC